MLKAGQLNLFVEGVLIDMGRETPFGTMIRNLHDLKQAAIAAGHLAHIRASGSTRAALRVEDLSIEVACRTNPQDDDRWWFWFDRDEPISAVGDLSAAVLIIERRAEALSATTS